VISPPAGSQRGPGRPAITSHEQVFEAAKRIVTEEGFDALSVRRIADRLGISAFSAHRHMGSKEQLLDELVAAAIEDRGSRTGRFTTWREGLREYALDMWELLCEHPTLAAVVTRSVRTPDAAMAAIERMTVLAERDGVPVEDFAALFEMVWVFVLGAASALHARAQLDEQGLLRARAEEIREGRPGTAKVLECLAAHDRREQFEPMLDRLIASLR
jgi:AcrR family transcriptional regulator